MSSIMGESRFNKPESYLRKLRQTEGDISSEAVRDSIKRLAVPLAEVGYKEADSVATEAEKLDLSFSYSSLDDETQKKIAQLFADSDRQGVHVDGLRLLDSFRFGSSKDQIDLVNLLPSDYKVVFLSNASFDGGFVSLTSKIVYVGARVETPLAMAILLHELGHVDDFKEMEKAGIDPAERPPEYGVVREVETLRRERVANAFAIKKLKPFIRAGILAKDDVINFLKYHAQKSHDIVIRGELSYKRSMARYARDIEDEMRWGDQELERELQEEAEREGDKK